MSQIAVPADPNDCGYKLTMATRKDARAHARATPESTDVPYHCTVCHKWHFRTKGSKPKNAP